MGTRKPLLQGPETTGTQVRRKEARISNDTPNDGPRRPALGVWRLTLPAAPLPLLLRRDRPFDNTATATSAADVLRYVAVARATLSGPLVLEIDGPGDPLASPETVLRSLALVHEHHPDVLTGLVIDGPLLAEYQEELEAFGLNYLALRLDAVRRSTAQRLVDGAVYRADLLDREAAAALYVDESKRALYVARESGIPVAIRTTLIPTVNADEIGEIARVAAEAGAERMDIHPHDPRPDTPLVKGGIPTDAELDEARAQVHAAFERVELHEEGEHPELSWLAPDRFQPVDIDALEAVDVLRILPDPLGEEPEPGRVLPRRRAQLIAVASRDGTLVDRSLTDTPNLRIYAVTQDHIRLIGGRTFVPDRRRREDGVGDARVFLRSLVGCSALVATQLSKRAVTLLQAVGIRPVAVRGPVEEILDRVARGTLRHAQDQ